MPDPSFIILYVDAPPESAAFYADLLTAPVSESSPTFAMLPLRPGVMLGLWSRHSVEPAAAAAGGGGEIGFTADGSEPGRTVDAIHADWSRRGLAILQAPVDMEFGRTFVALDPDGHRLRVFTPAG